jgi:hypothetical protein
VTNSNAAWKPTAVTRPLEVDPDELAAALATRRELGADAEEALVEGFLNHAGQAIDARVDQRIAQHRAAGHFGAGAEHRSGNGGRITLALGSMALAIPLTGIATQMNAVVALVMTIVTWVAIIAVNVSFNANRR